MQIKLIASADFPIEVGSSAANENKEAVFCLHVFRENSWGLKNVLGIGQKLEHAVLVYGEPKNGSLVRVHSECLTGDVFHASNCDCGNQLHYACSEIVKAGSGIVIYMRGQEGRGNGLSNKVKAVNLEASEDLDTVDAHRALGLPVENRHFDVAVKIIKDFFHLTAITLLTNNPIKIVPFEQAGILVKRRAGWVKETAQNRRYLETKINRMGHYPDGRVSGDFDNTLDPIE